MSYSTITSVTKKINERTLIQLLNDEVRPEDEVDLTDAADVVVVRFNQAAADAQAEIDPYLIGRYTLPFASVPAMVVLISDAITKHNIYKRRGDVPESDENEYKQNVKMLEKISSGLIDLGVVDEPQNLSNEITTNKTASDRIFNKTTLDKF